MPTETEVSIALLCQLLHSKTNQELLESTAVIKVAIMKSTDDFCCAKEAITCNQKINTFHCQHELNTKEDTGSP